MRKIREGDAVYISPEPRSDEVTGWRTILYINPYDGAIKLMDGGTVRPCRVIDVQRADDCDAVVGVVVSLIPAILITWLLIWGFGV